MIHLEDTLFTRLAVMCSGGLCSLAFSAPALASSGMLMLRIFLLDWVFWSPFWRYPSRVSAACSGVAYQETRDQGIEDNCFIPFERLRLDAREQVLGCEGQERYEG